MFLCLTITTCNVIFLIQDYVYDELLTQPEAGSCAHTENTNTQNSEIRTAISTTQTLLHLLFIY